VGLDPLEEYNARAARWRTFESRFQRQFIQIGNARLVTGIVFAMLAGFVFVARDLSPWWLLAPVIVFIALTIVHARVIRQRAFASRAIRYYEQRLTRLADSPTWIGKGATGDRFRDLSHVYSEDLDVFGKGSLFELLSSARTAAGEQMLASWLLSPATREVVLERQAAVRELRGRLDLREQIAFIGEDVRSSVDIEKLDAWGSAAAIQFARMLRPLAFTLSIAAAATLLAFFAHALPLSPFAATLACNIALIAILRKRVSAIGAAAETPAADLRIFSLLLARLETESFESPLLVQLQREMVTRGVPASLQIARLERWVDLLDSADHLLLRVLRPVLLWNEQAALGLETARQRIGPSLGAWIRAVAQFEALSAFASLALERPHWCFPDLAATADPCFEAEALQHPLMSPRACVPNDVSLSNGLRLLIVSGSNMSGKSTLLRAIGLNTVLGWAGAPVAARSMRLSPLQASASIRIFDSLQDNRSRFFAEIMRLRQILDLTHLDRCVLFLLDELLSGTNSHDRRIGAAGIVRGLIDSGAIGLVTTHDLALADIAAALGPRAANVHFEDRFANGQIEFDYRLRPGVVTRSNALELMRAIGLEV
jgi:hypothetical protein